MGAYGPHGCEEATPTPAHQAIARWEEDHIRPCGLELVEALGLIEPSASACAAFQRILQAVANPYAHEVRLDDLAVVHSHNPLTLRQVDIRYTAGGDGALPVWKLDTERLAATVACPQLFHVTLHRCDLRNGWLDRLIAGVAPGDRLVLCLKSCMYSHDASDTLILNDRIPRLAMDPSPRTLKLKHNDGMSFFAWPELTTVQLPPNLVTVQPSVHRAALELERGERRAHVDEQVLHAEHVEVATLAPPEVGRAPVREREVWVAGRARRGQRRQVGRALGQVEQGHV